MKTKVFRNSKAQYEFGEKGFWGNNENYIPLLSVRLLVLLEEGEDVLWVAYSPSFKWVYLCRKKDKFIEHLEHRLANKERFKIISKGKDPNYQEGYIYELEDGLKLYYSYRADNEFGPHLTIKFTNNRNDKPFTNSISFTYRAYNLNLNEVEIAAREMTLSERRVSEDPRYKFAFGEFATREKRMASWLKFVLIVFLVLFIAWLGNKLGIAEWYLNDPYIPTGA